MPPLRRGPRPPVDESPLPFERTGDDVADFERFCATYVRVSGDTAMVVRPWQLDIVAMVWGEHRPKLAALAIGRGNAKSTLCAAMCLYRLFLDDDSAIDLLAYDERQAGIIGGICSKMISRHPALTGRAKLFKDHIVVRLSELWWLPATPAALEGRTPDWTVCDEGGVIHQDVFEVAAFSASKKPHAQLFLIGTPGDKPGNVLELFRDYCIGHPEDDSQRYMEFSADRWRDHPLDCDDHGDGIGSGCLTAANPALGDWLARDSLLSNLPPKTSEQKWRTRRLVQFWATGNSEPPLPPELWNDLGNGEDIPAGARVVLGFDGSYSGTDATVLVAATVSPTPHVQLVQWWGRPDPKDSEYRVPILEVEQAIREACRRWDVVEVAADSYRWQRSLAVLEADGLPVKDFPQSISRMSAATSGFLDACRNGQLSHSGHPLIGEHLNNAVLTEDGRGGRLVKASRSRHAGRIDAAVTAVMAVSRATWHGTKPTKSKKVWSFPS
jgi:phage terminase large subunit-like protein